MKLGIEAAFRVANASGGVHGRQLRLIAADDGYEPTRTAVTMKQLYERDQVFGVVGNVGTPTAAVGLPYALDRKMLFFGAFTGAGLLRSDPPDRYVFNYRASYAEETEAIVQLSGEGEAAKAGADRRLCPAGRVRRLGFRRRSQSYPFARRATTAQFCGSITSATPWMWTRPSRNSRRSNSKERASQ